MLNLRCTALRVISVCDMVLNWSPKKKKALQNDQEVPQKSKNLWVTGFYHTCFPQ